MALLPIVDRELRVVSRKTSLFSWRLMFAGIAIVIGGGSLFSLSRGHPIQTSQEMFTNLVNLSFLYCSLAGVWVTSDCLSVERRNETLGLLFLTKLRGIDVVVGKMVATSLLCGYGVLALFPVLAIPLLIGGVSLAEFCRVLLVLVLTLFLSLSLGVLVSSRSLSAVKSGMVVFFLMLGLCLQGPLFVFVFQLPAGSIWQVALSFFSPAFAIYASYDNHYTELFGVYWASIGVGILLIGLSLGLASYFVRQGWRQSAAGSPQGGVPLSRSNEATNARARARWGRRESLSENPIYWLLSRKRSKPVWVFSVFGLLGVYWLIGRASSGTEFYNEGNYLMMAFVIQLVIKCWVGVEAASRFGEDRRSGALELLLCTPLKVRDIVKGHVESLYWQFFWPVLMVLLIGMAFLLEPLTSRFALIDRATILWIQLMVASMVLFVLDLYALSWLGMWKGLNARYVNRAILLNLISVLTVPWAIFVLFVMFFASVSGPGRMAGNENDEFLLGVWFAVGMFSSGYWWYRGKQCLTEGLRQVAPFSVGDLKKLRVDSQ